MTRHIILTLIILSLTLLCSTTLTHSSFFSASSSSPSSTFSSSSSSTSSTTSNLDPNLILFISKLESFVNCDLNNPSSFGSYDDMKYDLDELLDIASKIPTELITDDLSTVIKIIETLFSYPNELLNLLFSKTLNPIIPSSTDYNIHNLVLLILSSSGYIDSSCNKYYLKSFPFEFSSCSSSESDESSCKSLYNEVWSVVSSRINSCSDSCSDIYCFETSPNLSSSSCCNCSNSFNNNDYCFDEYFIEQAHNNVLDSHKFTRAGITRSYSILRSTLCDTLCNCCDTLCNCSNTNSTSEN